MDPQNWFAYLDEFSREPADKPVELANPTMLILLRQHRDDIVSSIPGNFSLSRIRNLATVHRMRMSSEKAHGNDLL
jgi:hypothetical protein